MSSASYYWSRVAGSIGRLAQCGSGLGLSQRLVEWFVKWTTQVAMARTIRVAAFEGGLGRIMFVVGALEHERSFLGHCLNL